MPEVTLEPTSPDPDSDSQSMRGSHWHSAGAVTEMRVWHQMYEMGEVVHLRSFGCACQGMNCAGSAQFLLPSQASRVPRSGKRIVNKAKSMGGGRHLHRQIIQFLEFIHFLLPSTLSPHPLGIYMVSLHTLICSRTFSLCLFAGPISH